jgi:23S rRNA (cytosine1962-C5)-methyltransferase
MPGLVVRPRAHILHGHDWVYSTEVLKMFGSPADGDVISIKDGRDRLLGVAIYNSKSQIVARRFSRRRQDLDRDFFERRIGQAAAYRDHAGCRRDLRRVVWSESDGLPGVIIDQYGDVAVLQTLTLAMDQRKSVIADCLASVLGVTAVIERNDAPIRTLEGLAPATGILAGDPPAQATIDLDGVLFDLDLLSGQKTGFYLDQVRNYATVAALASGKSVLDCFSNQGGFAFACARRGASRVVAVESGADCIERLHANADRNRIAIEIVREDVFDYLKRAEQAALRFDLVILDPPSFTRSRSRIRDAMRGYHDLHVRAAHLLNPGGLLATFSCSHHVQPHEFLDMIRDAFHDARRSARVIETFRQSPDHPVLLSMPETAYLNGFLLESMPGR